MDISIGAFEQLTLTRIPTTRDENEYGVITTQKTQGTSLSAGVLGTFHQQFKPWLGYNANLGYTRFTENYSSGSAFSSKTPRFPSESDLYQGSIGTNMYETTIAAVAQGPRNNRLSTFGQFGGGGLWFLPNTHPEAYSKQVRPAMLFGAGINYKLSDHLGIRAEYRGLFYKSPDFAVSLNIAPVSKMFTVTSEPTVSVTYTFGNRKRRDK
jgi:opacity protein-like surface antigen